MKKIVVVVIFFATLGSGRAQGVLGGGNVSGNLQLDAQISREDSTIGAPKVPEKLLSNAFLNAIYTNGGFTAGLRFESYLNPILGFSKEYKGSGFAYKFLSYRKDRYEVTAGNFYDQFGNGLIFRSFQEPNLGLDNAMNGLSVKATPINGLYIKSFIGKQRYFWTYGPGIVRGVDGEVSINDMIESLVNSKTRISLGAGFVSKYEDDEQIIKEEGEESFQLKLPLNVGAWATRFNLARGRFSLQGEYARKGQDPNALNNYIYREGQGLFLSGSYSQKGLGINIQAKRLDNMNFKSKRTQTGEMLNINFLPALTRQHTSIFMSLYPYATQIEGEMGIQLDVVYTFKKKTLLGGKYGMDMKVNYSRAHSIEKTPLLGDTVIMRPGTLGYNSRFFAIGDEMFYEDFNIEFGRKISSDVKLRLAYAYITFNPVVEGHGGDPFHYNNVFVGEVVYKLDPTNVLRFESEWLFSNTNESEDDKRTGDWIMLSGEYNFSTKFFFSLSDQYNYRGSKQHYYGVSAGYTYGTSRIQLTYGKQREGIICIGGVCRQAPASNGFMLSLTSSF